MLKQVMKNSVRLEEEAKEADQESTRETPTEIDEKVTWVISRSSPKANPYIRYS